MLGAIIGDIAGARFEFNNHRSKDFEIFSDLSFVTDDTVMTIAVGKAIMETVKAHPLPTGDEDIGEPFFQLLYDTTIRTLREIGQGYPDCGFGGMFYQWIFTDNPKPYNSFGNGAGMRVSPAGFAANNLKQAVSLSKAVTAVTHNHPEGLKGAEATAVAIFMARTGSTKNEIRQKIAECYYPLDFTADEIRPTYKFNETCQDTVPQAIVCFLESDSFEDAIRTAVSIGGDSDTLAAITGGFAEAFYGIPEDFQDTAMTYLNVELLNLVIEWQAFMIKNPATAKN
jgi:type I restriction enzyme M protein